MVWPSILEHSFEIWITLLEESRFDKVLLVSFGGTVVLSHSFAQHREHMPTWLNEAVHNWRHTVAQDPAQVLHQARPLGGGHTAAARRPSRQGAALDWYFHLDGG